MSSSSNVTPSPTTPGNRVSFWQSLWKKRQAKTAAGRRNLLIEQLAQRILMASDVAVSIDSFGPDGIRASESSAPRFEFADTHSETVAYGLASLPSTDVSDVSTWTVLREDATDLAITTFNEFDTAATLNVKDSLPGAGLADETTVKSTAGQILEVLAVDVSGANAAGDRVQGGDMPAQGAISTGLLDVNKHLPDRSFTTLFFDLSNISLTDVPAGAEVISASVGLVIAADAEGSKEFFAMDYQVGLSSEHWGLDSGFQLVLSGDGLTTDAGQDDDQEDDLDIELNLNNPARLLLGTMGQPLRQQWSVMIADTLARGDASIEKLGLSFVWQTGRPEMELVSPSFTTAENYNLQFTFDGRLHSVATTLEPGENHKLIQATVDGFEFLQAWPITRVTSLADRTELEYNDFDEVSRRTDGLDRVTTYGHDWLGRLTDVTDPDGQLSRFQYDANDNLIAMLDERGWTRFSYTNLDLIDTMTSPDGSEVSYRYNAAGDITRITYPDGSAVSYAYNQAGRLSAVTESGQTTSYAYDRSGRLTTTTFANGIVSTRGYDGYGRLASLVYSDADGLLEGYAYQRDTNGNITRIDEQRRNPADPSGAPLTSARTHAYDARSRLVRTANSDGSSVEYTFDAADNRATMTTREPGEPVRTLHYHYAYENRLDRVTNEQGVETARYYYDSAGNLRDVVSPDGTVHYSYDHRNLLTLVESGSDRVALQYDALGRLRARIENGVKTEFVIDPNREHYQILAENREGATTARYVYGLGRIAGYLPGSSEAAYYHGDHLGSTRLMTGSNGQIVSDYDYGDFGMPRDSTAEQENPFQFNGEFFDPLTDLVFLRARWYAPGMGRFLTKDPSGFDDGPNVYPFVAGNPVNLVDPTGNYATCNDAFGCDDGLSRRVARDLAEEVVEHAFDAVSRTKFSPIAALRAARDIHKAYRRGGARAAFLKGITPTPGNVGTGADIARLIAREVSRRRRGGVLLDKPVNFVGDISSLAGAQIDPLTKQVVLLGEGGGSVEGLRLDDLVTALRVVFASPEYPGVTIDPNPDHPDDPAYPQIVRLFAGLEDTEMGHVLYEADRVMKTLSAARDNISGQPVASQAAGYKSMLDRWADRAVATRGGSRGESRFWFVPSEMQLVRSADGQSFVFDRSAVQLRTENMLVGGGATDPDAAAFTEWFNDNFATLASEDYVVYEYPTDEAVYPYSASDPSHPQPYTPETPIFQRLEEVARAIAFARFLKDSGIEIDFSWVDQYQTPVVNTPRETHTVYNERTVSWDEGVYRYTVKLAMTGGVTLSLPNAYLPDTGAASAVGNQALKDRPAEQTLAWETQYDGRQLQAAAVSFSADRLDGNAHRVEVDLEYPTAGQQMLRLRRIYDSFDTSPGSVGSWRVDPFAIDFQGRKIYSSGHRATTDFNGLREGEVRVQDRVTGREWTFYSTFDVETLPDGRVVFGGLNDEGLPSFVATDNGDGSSLTVDSQLQYTLTRPDGSQLVFDEDGRILNSIDPFQRQIVYRWNDEGVSSITDSLGRGLQLQYTDGRLTTVHGLAGDRVMLQYDHQGDLVGVKRILGGAVTTVNYQNDADHRLTRVVEDGVEQWRADADLYGRPGVQADNRGNTWTVHYDRATGTTTTIHDQAGTRTVRVADELDRPRILVDELNRVTRRAYQGSHEQPSWIFSPGRPFRLLPDGTLAPVAELRTYDEFGNLLTIEDVLRGGDRDGDLRDDHPIQFRYDDHNNLIEHIDARGIRTSFAYNDAGQVTERRVDLGDGQHAVWKNRYDEDGNLVAEIDPMGRETHSTRDEFGNAVATSVAPGTIDQETTTSSYDQRGQLLRQTDGEDRTIDITYNARGDILTTTLDGPGVEAITSSNTHDPVTGHLVSSLDFEGNTTAFERDSVTGDVVRIIVDPGGPSEVAVSFAYDRFGNRSALEDGAGNRALFGNNQRQLETTTMHVGWAPRVTGLSGSAGGVEVEFGESMSAREEAIWVVDAGGSELDGDRVWSPDGRTLSWSPPGNERLGAGVYTIELRDDGLFDGDGNPLDGELTGRFPSGDGLPGGVFRGTWSVDDHDDSSEYATSIVIGTELSAVVAPAGDADWFVFEAEENHEYQIDVVIDGGETTLADSYLRLYDSDGQRLLAENDDAKGAGRASRINFKAPHDGQFFVSARAFGDNLVGGYQLRTALLTDDHGDDLLGATALQLPITTTLVIEVPSDVDWFTFDAEAGETYRMVLRGAAGEDTVLGVHDGTAFVAVHDDVLPGIDRSSRIDFQANQTGTFGIAAWTKSETEAGTLRLSISHDDHSDGADRATPIQVAALVHGTLEVDDDVDTFQVQLEAGDYQLAGHGVTRVGEPQTDVALAIFDSQGQPVAHNDNHLGDPDPHLYLRLATAGTYFLQVQKGQLGARGEYTLLVTSPADDHANAPTHGTPIVVGQTLDGQLGMPDDIDVFLLDAKQGERFEVLVGLDGLADSILQILQPNDGTLLASNDNLDSNSPASRLNWMAPATGVYPIVVGSKNEAYAGGFHLSVRPLENEPPVARLLAPIPGSNINQDVGYVEVRYTDAGGSGLVDASIGTTDLVLSAVVAREGGFDVVDVPVDRVEDLGAGRVRYWYRGSLPEGEVQVRVFQGAVSDEAENWNVDYAAGFTFDHSAPLVVNVSLASSKWTPDSPLAEGYAIPVGSQQQLAALPWIDLDRITIEFSEPVAVRQSDLTATGANQQRYSVRDFAYDETTNTATWTLDQTIEADSVLIELSAAAVDRARNALDGEWSNGGDVYPSGDGQPGGTFEFRFNALTGDANQGGSVSVADVVLIRNSAFTTPTDAQYTVFRDISADALISVRDVVLARNRAFQALPASSSSGKATVAPLGSDTIHSEHGLGLRIGAIEVESDPHEPVRGFFDVFVATPDDSFRLAGYQIAVTIEPADSGVQLTGAAEPANAVFGGRTPQVLGTGNRLLAIDNLPNINAEVAIADGAALLRIEFEAAAGTIGTFRLGISAAVTELVDGGGELLVIDTFEPGTIRLATDENELPVLARNAGLTVNQGGEVSANEDVLWAVDVDTPDSQLEFTLLAAPVGGSLWNGDRVLGVGAPFTQADLNANHIRYQHDGGAARRDTFAVAITDVPGSRQVLRDGLELYDPLATRAHDVSGSGVSSSMFGDPRPATDRHGRAAQAVLLDGVDDYLSGGIATSFEGESRSVWFKTDQADQFLLGRASGDSRSYHVGINANGEIFYEHYRNGLGGYVAVRGPRVDDDRWHHLVAVNDNASKSIALFIDGQLAERLTETDPAMTAWAGTGSTAFGRVHDLDVGENDGFFTGALDDAAIWSRALTAEDVGEIYRFAVADVDIAINPVSQGGWAIRDGGPTDDAARALAKDAAGNTFVASSTHHEDGRVALQISKVAANGDPVWTKNVLGSDRVYANDVVVDQQGRVTVVGKFAGSVSFGEDHVLNSSGSYDMFVVQLSSSTGEVRWSAKFGGNSGVWDAGHAVAADDRGDLYLIGSFGSTINTDPDATEGSRHRSQGRDDVVVIKLDGNDGRRVWSKSFGGTDADVGTAIAVDSDGGLYASGYFYSQEAVFGDFTLHSLVAAAGNPASVFVVKLDAAAGDVRWARSIDGPGWRNGTAIDVDQHGVYLAGTFQSRLMFDDGTQREAVGSFDWFVAGLDKGNGARMWDQELGGWGDDRPNDLVVFDGAVYAAGYYNSTMTVEGTGYSSRGASDIVLVKLAAASGQLDWLQTIGGSEDDRATGVAASAEAIFLTGHFSGLADFPTGSGTVTLEAAGDKDVFVLKQMRLGSVSGDVFEDLDLDGMRDANEAAQSGWTVYLDVNQNQVLDAIDRVAITDDQGSYRFAGLVAGNYQVRLKDRQSYTGTNEVTVTIEPGQQASDLDLGVLSQLSIDDVSIVEGDTDSTDLVFNVQLPAPATANVSVNYVTRPQTAAAGVDYRSVNGTLQIPAGAESATITVPVFGDREHEATQTLEVVLSGSTHAALGRDKAKGAIVDDDALDGWAVGAGSAGDEGGRALAVDLIGNAYTLSTIKDGTAGMQVELARYSADGDRQWSRRIESTQEIHGAAVVVDQDGRVTITGRFLGIADFDPDSSAGLLESPESVNIFLAQFDADSGALRLAKQLGGRSGEWDAGYGLSVDGQGNLYLTGTFGGTLDADPDEGAALHHSRGQNDLFVIKLDADARYVFSRTFGGEHRDYGIDVSVDAVGDIYLSGYFYSDEIELDGFQLNSWTNEEDASRASVLIVKMDSSGVVQWAKSLDGPGWRSGSAIATDETGVYITGPFQGSLVLPTGEELTATGWFDIYTIKLDKIFGELEWAHAFGSWGDDRSVDLAVVGDGVYVAGYFQQTVNVGDDVLPSAGESDGLVVKLNASNGRPRWAQRHGGEGDDRLGGVSVDAAKNMTLIGHFSSDIEINTGGGLAPLTSSGGRDLLLVKQEAVGSFSGVVFQDGDLDGARDAHEPGSAGWTIYVDDDLNGELDAGETQVVSDADGLYEIRGLREGTHVVRLRDDAQFTATVQIRPDRATFGATTVGGYAKSAGPDEFDGLFGESIATANAGQAASHLIGLTDFRDDPRFRNIDGRDSSVVIIDTGIDVDHPFFGGDENGDGIADRIVFQYDFLADVSDASDVRHHGSHVSSIIASSDPNQPGVAPGVQIIHLKVFPDTEDGLAPVGVIEEALQWVIENVDTYNIVAVNLSLGGGNYQTAQQAQSRSDEFATLASLGVLTVAASGNSFYGLQSAPGVAYPAADPNVISVGAVYTGDVGSFRYGDGAVASSTGADRITPFSQRHESLITIVAPGAPITAANALGSQVTLHGTSQATPYVTGAAVVAQQLAERELGRRLNLAEFIQLMQMTAATVNDGDDEHDNVANTGLDFPRIDVWGLAEQIMQSNPLARTVMIRPGSTVASVDFAVAAPPSGPQPVDDFELRPSDVVLQANRGTGTGQLRHRSSSTDGRNILFHTGDSRRLEFELPKAGTYDVYALVTNDGGADRQRVQIGSELDVTFTVEGRSNGGHDWDRRQVYYLGSVEFTTDPNHITWSAVLTDIFGTEVDGAVLRLRKPAEPTLRIAGASAVEGESLQFKLTLSEASDAPIEVEFQVRGDTASEGADYQAVATTVTMPGGVREALITIPTLTDELVELTERLEVRLVSADGAEIVQDVAVGQILDESPLLQITLTAVDADGQQIDRVLVGQSFDVVATVDDLRSDGAGAFSVYLDVLFNSGVVSLGNLHFSDAYREGQSGTIAENRIDEVGAFTTTAPGGNATPLFRFTATATAAGRVEFVGEPADLSPAHAIQLFGSDAFVEPGQIRFLQAAVDVILNSAPRAEDDRYEVAEDQVLTVAAAGGVLANDADSEGDVLTVQLVDAPQHGQLVLEENGGLVYRPLTDFHGQVRFTYLANDGNVNSEVATVTIDVQPVNDPPTAVDDQYRAGKNQQLHVDRGDGLLANDFDVDSRDLTIELLTQPAHGSVKLNPDGSFSYLPDDDFTGADRFTYGVSDEALTSSEATVTIDVLRPKVRVQLQLAKLDGAPLTRATVGQPVLLRAVVEDLGDDPQGVFAAYVDVLFDQDKFKVAGPIQFGGSYPNGRSGATDSSGLNEVGAFANATPFTTSGPHLLFSVPLVALAMGEVAFTLDAADVAEHETSRFGHDEPVPRVEVEFVDAMIEIGRATWTNPRNRLDVNADGIVSPGDVLVLVNRLNAGSGGELPIITSSTSPPPYLDPSGDGLLAPNDVLLIINALNFAAAAAAEGMTSSTMVASAFQPQSSPVRHVDSDPKLPAQTLVVGAAGRETRAISTVRRAATDDEGRVPRNIEAFNGRADTLSPLEDVLGQIAGEIAERWANEGEQS